MIFWLAAINAPRCVRLETFQWTLTQFRFLTRLIAPQGGYKFDVLSHQA